MLYFLSGNATDALDGYLARKWKVESRYGKIVDPIADKCFNLLALGCTSVFVNPLLLGLVASEAAIAGITVAHTINNIKDKNIDMSKLTMLDKTKLFVETADELKVSRIGRKKAVIMVLAASLAYTSALVPLLSIPASAFIIGVTVAELPVISRYATEYYVDKKRYKIESSIECNVTNNELGKLKS